MTNLITTLEHAYAVAISDLKKTARFVQSKVLPALEHVHAEAPTIEAVTGVISPQLANIERVGDALLGTVIKTIEDAGQATGGITVSLAAELVADIKAIIPVVKATANTAPVTAPSKA